MLTQLDVYNYTLVNELNLEIKQGLTTLTGETGAGKSLLLDAIGLAMGNKARGDAIGNPTSNAEVSALFDVSEPSLKASIEQWLQENGLPEHPEYQLKRIITPQGRSRCFINGRTVTLAQLQHLGAKLINIHGQHEHQALLNTATQRKLIDTFGQYPERLSAVSSSFAQWQKAQHALTKANEHADALSAQFQLLKYQVEELEQLDLGDKELATLEAQQKKLANAEACQNICQAIVNASGDTDASIQQQLRHTVDHAQSLEKLGFEQRETLELLQTALINIEEATHNIEQLALSFTDQDINLNTVEQRLSDIYTVARKHKIHPQALYEHQQQLIAEFAQLNHSDEHIESLQKQVDSAQHAYMTASSKLTTSRTRAAKKITKAINQTLGALNMTGADFRIELEPLNQPTALGAEHVHFLISTIPGKQPGPLSKIASGGELSRIGLAIQVATATSHTVPTLIFDEVDAGIGGTTGDIVGRLLRKLGTNAQVLCVTHLAQVASKAHNHLLVKKSTYKKSLRSSIEYLEGDTVVSEVARMVGGPVDTETSLAHAREMMTAH